jgi:hypothetical protein
LCKSNERRVTADSPDRGIEKTALEIRRSDSGMKSHPAEGVNERVKTTPLLALARSAFIRRAEASTYSLHMRPGVFVVQQNPR